jgi:hypothetical protein
MKSSSLTINVFFFISFSTLHLVFSFLLHPGTLWIYQQQFLDNFFEVSNQTPAAAIPQEILILQGKQQSS